MSSPFQSCLGHLRSSDVGVAPPAISLTGGWVMLYKEQGVMFCH